MLLLVVVVNLRRVVVLVQHYLLLLLVVRQVEGVLASVVCARVHFQSALAIQVYVLVVRHDPLLNLLPMGSSVIRKFVFINLSVQHT